MSYMKKKTESFPMKYVDGILMVDHNARILYSVRFNPRFNKSRSLADLNSIIGKNLLDVYKNITPETSTIYECLRTGNTVYTENQVLVDSFGEIINIHNITIPIINAGKILGAVELSQDITKMQEQFIDEEDSDSKKISAYYRRQKEFYDFGDIITKDPFVLQLIEKAKIIAAGPSPVLVYGETGTGKELFVQAIHKNSPYSKGPFIDQNCASFPETLIESLLFGSVKGAFTGATDRVGLFEAANQGTLFLDEINSMPYHLQSKLLRILQNGHVKRIGATKVIHTQVRIITAMNLNPFECVRNKILRDDLFYRLNVNSLEIPPLRRRKDDILLLADYFIDRYNQTFATEVEGLSADVSALFLSYSWPGNVRELQHVIESAMNMYPKRLICYEHLPIYLSPDSTDHFIQDPSNLLFSLPELSEGLSATMNKIERELIIKTWNEQKRNISRTAALLKIPRQTLQYKLKKFGL